jgi:hypothetical protein
MTNQQLFDDIKILVMTTIGQTEERLGQRMDKLEHRMVSLEQKVNEGFVGVGDAIDELNKIIDTNKVETDKRLDEHDQQIKQLQAQTA